MKKTVIVLASLLMLSGCSFMAKQIDYQKECMADPTCLEQAKKDAELAKTIISMAYPVAGAPVGAAILAFALWFRGKKKKDSQNG